MVTEPVVKTIITEVDLTLERYGKLEKPVVFNENCSTLTLKADRDAAQAALDEEEAAAKALEAATAKKKEKLQKLVKAKSSFMVQAGQKFTKDSDEYVWAGGTRQSEAIERARITRIEKAHAEAERQKAEEERLKAEAERQKTEEAGLKVEMERQKAEIERLKAEAEQLKAKG